MTTELVAGRSETGQATPATTAIPVAADDPRLDAWRSFIHAHARITRTLDEELQATHHLSLAEYDALLQLVNAPGHRLRMSALADRVLLSRSGITRLVDRLVAAGMVERTTCTTDARGAEAALTQRGLDHLRDASRTHLEGVGRLFLDVLEPAERETLQRGLDRVLANLSVTPLTSAECTVGSGEA
jgi:DNA-binding MarR family transcriptional regulator